MQIFFKLAIVITIFFTTNIAFAATNPDMSAIISAADKGEYSKANSLARQNGSKSLINFVRWHEIRLASYNLGFYEIYEFMKENPSWPEQEKMQSRLEEALNLKVPFNLIYDYFSQNQPKSGRAKFYYAMAIEKLDSEAGSNKKDEQLIQKLAISAYETGIFSNDEQEYFTKHFMKYITQENVVNRTNFLIDKDRLSEAKTLLNSIKGDEKSYLTARIQIRQGNKGFKIAEILAQVPLKYKNQPGLLWDQSQVYKKAKVPYYQNILEHLSGTMPYSCLVWTDTKSYIRDLIQDKKYHLAYSLAKNNGCENSADASDGQWLAGWIALRFLHQPQQALQHFEKMYYTVTYRVSLARAAYWSGRALDELNDKQKAGQWYEKAGKYFDTFYGQLANHHLHGKNKLAFDNLNNLKYNENITKNELFTIAQYAYNSGYEDVAAKFLKQLVKTTKNKDDLYSILKSVDKFGNTRFTVELAKHAAKQDLLVEQYLYPKLNLKSGSDSVLALSIIRQESLFDQYAVSYAGAMGLMQLMPYTAERFAKKLGLPYAKSKITKDKDFNILLGTTYLDFLKNYFDQSYILSIASYNAGENAVKKWPEKYGDPKKLKHLYNIIDWMEQIPYYQTRDYVQRVLENMEIYQTITTTKEHKTLIDFIKK